MSTSYALGRISIIERLPERVLECGDLSPLSPLDRLVDQAEPPQSGSSQSQHVSDPDGDKSPAQSGDKSPHSKKWDAPHHGNSIRKAGRPALPTCRLKALGLACCTLPSARPKLPAPP